MGCSGHAVVRTPNLDRLAARGVLFKNTYCGSPVCCPSRASLMTGMFPHEVGVYNNATCFDGRATTWAERLRAGGYRCWATGKLDLCTCGDLGFEQVETDHGNYTEPDISGLFRRPLCFRVDSRRNIGTLERRRPHKDVRRVEVAREFLASARTGAQPWLAWVGFDQPKSFDSGGMPEFLAWYPPESVQLPPIPEGHLESLPPLYQGLRNFQLFSTAMTDERIRRGRAAYFARVSETDAYVGELLHEMERKGHAENTVVIYTSDHGEMNGEHGLWAKNTLLEAASRVPLIIAGPGWPTGKVVDTPVSQVDLVATLLEMGGMETPADLRGTSLRPLVDGDTSRHRGFAISECQSEGNYTGSFLIRRGDWKYIHIVWDNPLLFNLRDDPNELHDLAGDAAHAGIRKELEAALRSLVDPESVTEQAFEEQERRLDAMVKRLTAEEFFLTLRGRLGQGQARALTSKFYRGR